MEGRYATALFSAASKQNKLDQVEQELGKVSVSQKNEQILMLLPLSDDGSFMAAPVIYLTRCLNMLFIE